MNHTGVIGRAILALALASLSCSRLADDGVPEWLFDVYSNFPVTVTGEKQITRYTFHEDHRVTVVRDPSCSGGVQQTWELVWEVRGDNLLTLRAPPEVEEPVPGSDLYSEWVLRYDEECETMELNGVRRGDGVLSYTDLLYRGAVCSEYVEPPDEPGNWDVECDYSWCEAPPNDGCELP